ncbi:MAG: nucleotidyltransferase family protein [candidate division FCPU426 bacterium]
MNLPPLAILAGGLATRLQAETERTPKSLLQVAGKPFIDHQLEQLAGQGVERVLVCTGHLGEAIERHVGDGRAFGLSVEYSRDGERLLGTAGALHKALPRLDDIFFVLYGDSYLDVNLAEVYGFFRSTGKLGLMTVHENQNRWDRSNVVYRVGHIIRYDKQNPDPEMTYIDYGLSLFRREAFADTPESGVEDLSEVFRRLVARGELLGYPAARRFYEIGSPQGLAETRAYLEGLREGGDTHGNG